MNTAKIIQELKFKGVKSSGAGGQHVNKVSTKIELSFEVNSSNALSGKEKERILLKLSHRLTKENVLLLQCDESRSQHKNKALAIKRFLDVIENALKVPKKRKKTKPSKASVERRLRSKKRAAQKKVNRSRPEFD
ncbi:MAG: alternative ribosome rescue aminoacyl-tRNA hydrolase ArfB [Maribacter sp.]